MTEVERDQSLTVDRDRMVTVKRDETVLVTRNHSLTSETGHVTIDAALGITLCVAENTIIITPAGITMNGITLNLIADAALSAVAPVVDIDSEGLITLNAAASIMLDAAGTIMLDAPGIFSTIPVIPEEI